MSAPALGIATSPTSQSTRKFAENLRQDVLAAAELEDSETLRSQAITERMITDLCDLATSMTAQRCTTRRAASK